MERTSFIFKGRYKTIIDSLPENEQLQEYRNFINLMLRREIADPFSGINNKLFNSIDGNAGNEVPAEIQEEFLNGGFIVCPWMVKVGLKGYELLVMAQIYSRTIRDEKSYCRNNQIQIAYDISSSQTPVHKAVNKLITMDLIRKNGQQITANLEKIREIRGF